MNNFKFYFYLLLLLLLIIMNIFGDDRSEPKDIILALDKSLSMETTISEVKKFINESIIDRLIKDDYFMVLIFYGTDEMAAAKYITDPEKDIPALKQIISKVFANGPFTDIGNVLDRLKDEFTERIDNKRKKECFLITDGINEPMRNSKYYSTDGILKHDLLSDLKDIIVKDGWKVQFLAIGEQDSKVEVIAQSITADYSQVKESVTSQTITDSIDDPIGSISIIKESILPIVIDQNGKGLLKFKVNSDRYLKNPEIKINNIDLTSSLNYENSLLISDYFIVLPPKGITDINIPVVITSNIPAGNHKATLLFSFSSSEHFDENEIEVGLHKNTIFENYRWLLVLIIIGALLLILVIILIVVTLIRGKPVEFKVIVKENPIPEGKNKFKLTKNKELYLTESLDVISITSKKLRKSICKLTYLSNGLKLRILNEYRFENIEKIPDNVLGQNIQIRTISNKIYNIAFMSLL